MQRDQQRPRRPLFVIPALNEEEAIGGVLTEVRARVPSVEVLVVDDGSTDRTAEIARAAGRVMCSCT